MAQPFVTVLMTVYNGGDYLKSALQSVLKQTYQDFEFLIVNDCSTDHTLETIKSINDPRIRVHTNEVNLGQTKSYIAANETPPWRALWVARKQPQRRAYTAHRTHTPVRSISVCESTMRKWLVRVWFIAG